jgi:uncharacterized membrane protein YgdD (TMEM256/DUF423 family)
MTNAPERSFILAGALSAGIGVGLGAFGAHGLRDSLGPQMLQVYETGVRYQLVHALALVLTGILAGRWPGRAALGIAGGLFLLGTLLFSGSLYVLTLTGMRWLGAVAPAGGTCLIGGWIALAYTAATMHRSPGASET